MKKISIVIVLSAVVLLSFGTGYWCALSDIDEPEESLFIYGTNDDGSMQLRINGSDDWNKICPIVFYNNSIDFINHNETHHRFDIVRNNAAILSVFVDKNTSIALQEFFSSMIYEILDMDYKLSSIADEENWRS